MSVSVRTRFEVFKRDSFTCRYCGRKSPEAILEIDHIVAVANGGTNDLMNLATSCWDCNRGKSDVPLSLLITGDDPHDKAVLVLERRRQLDEYNTVLARERELRTSDYKDLCTYWEGRTGWPLKYNDDQWLFSVLQTVPREVIRGAMDTAIKNSKTRNLAYVNGIIRRWRDEQSSDYES